MAEKKSLKGVDLAAGFFSTPAPTEEETSGNAGGEKITAPAPVKEKPKKEDTTETKNLGGRPKKDGLKNEQFTLTMNPEMYEKLRIVAEEQAGSNFSRLIDDAVKSYCREKDIDLSEINVDPKILEIYREKQNKKSKKK